MKSFSHFIVDLNSGTTNAALSRHLDELFQAVKAHGMGGSLTIKIGVAPAQSGAAMADKVNVSCDSQLKLPKPRHPVDFFFLTDDAEPTRRHPRQHEIDFGQPRAVEPASAPPPPLTPEAALAAAVAGGGAPPPVHRWTEPDENGEVNPIPAQPAPRSIG